MSQKMATAASGSRKIQEGFFPVMFKARKLYLKKPVHENEMVCA
jgi:hypothetical protein